MSFRLKLLLSMVLLVVGVTAAILLFTENQVQRSYERHFQQSFLVQMASFIQERDSRLEPVKERVTAAAFSTRLLAVLENAEREHLEQGDIDDLYQNGLDQLSGVLASFSAGGTNGPRSFFLFLNAKGEVLYPSASVPLPFQLAGVRPISRQVESVGAAAIRQTGPEVGYLAPEVEPGRLAIREMVFTPIVDQATHAQRGVLGVGFPLPSIQGGTLLSAIWLDNRLYSPSMGSNILQAVQEAVRPRVAPGESREGAFPISLRGEPHQVYYQALNAGPGFPQAYQVCLYSLAEAAAEKERFRRTILLLGTIAFAAALVLSWLFSRSLSVPVEKLVAGAAEIERGNYAAKVSVRGRDELGKLGSAFNSMAERIQASHAALEQRIAERTHELAERKRAEEALRKSEASLRDAQRIAHLGNWEWDVAANQLRWSDEIYAIFGLAPGQFGATYEAFLERVHPGDRGKVEQAVRESLENGKPYGLEHRVVRPDGESRVVREQAEVFRDEKGKTLRMVGTVQDVTEQKRIEAEFLRAQRMDGIGAIAGGMAHDLNNALAPILMGVQIIRSKVDDPEVRQMLAVMETNTHRGAEMVRQVLTFARGRDGEREMLDVGRLVREMENILRQTMPKSISVQAFVPPDLWQVLGNSTQLHQALLNLCVNARDAMPNGGKITLAADNVELGEAEAKEMAEAKPGAYVMVVVSDTGTGIPPEILPKIFDAFFTTKAPGKGTGLGLSTIVRIVRNHGGCLGVKSEVGSGTTFEIYLPRAETVPERPLGGRLQGVPVRAGRGELILFIDDDRSVREMVAPTLTEHGYRVVTAANGAEALAMFREHEAEVSLVLTDVAMPVIDGLEMMRRVHSGSPGLPVVLMSGTFEVTENPLPPGAAGFLSKPFRLEQLLAVISDALKTGASAAPQPSERGRS